MCAEASFGDKVIGKIAAYIAETSPQIKGFNRWGLYHMKQFYDTYKDDEFVTPLVTQISWTNHLLIMSGSKSAEECHFYMELCAKNRYSKRKLEHQMDSAYYERYMLSAKKPLPETVPQSVRGSILDSYVLEFLDLPEQYSERNLKKAILENLKQFILEFGKDFSFIGEEYRVQVGGQDFYIDLPFYNRALSCLNNFLYRQRADTPLPHLPAGTPAPQAWAACPSSDTAGKNGTSAGEFPDSPTPAIEPEL